MKLSLLMSNGETVALASRLIAAGASACTAQITDPLPSCDWLIFDESVPLASATARSETRRLLGEALSGGSPVFAFLSPVAPETAKCAAVMSEFFAYSSAAAVTPSGASGILGLDGEYEGDDLIGATFGDSESLSRMAALARELAELHELSFALVFDPDEGQGILFANGAYDTVAAESMENAVAELFRQPQ